MTVPKLIGGRLEVSGWTGALVKAAVATSETADSFQKASHVTRIWRAHQVTALFIMLQKDYIQCVSSMESMAEVLSLED